MTIPRFQKKILTWYLKNKRDFPWRKTSNPYYILVSEIMLQQTQISRVLPKYKEFLCEFPNLKKLSLSSNKKLFQLWKGLGYWRRALFLREAAKTILNQYKGKFPKEAALLERLPGIGHYTARALLCFGFKHEEAFLDTNIRRIYLHFFFSKRKSVSDKEILKIAEKAVWKKDPKKWHYALFDYGALVLKDKKINKKSLHYHPQSKFQGSFRSFRTKTMHYLLLKNKTTHQHLESFLKREIKRAKKSYLSKEVISSLLKDKLIKKTKTHYFV